MFGRLTPAVKTLLLVNIIIFAAGSLLDMDAVLKTFGGLVYVGAESFRVHQFFTYIFLHGDIMHLLGNMIGLFVFGPLLEQEWGSQRFMIYFLATGIGAGVIFAGVDYYETKKLEIAYLEYQDSAYGYEKFTQVLADNAEYKKMMGVSGFRRFVDDYAQNPNSPAYKQQSLEFLSVRYNAVSNVPMIGASGAIFGLIIAMALMYPNLQIMLLIPPIPIKMKYFAIAYGAFEVYQQIQNAANDNVAHLAHLAGMLVGFILIKMWYGRNYRRY